MHDTYLDEMKRHANTMALEENKTLQEQLQEFEDQESTRYQQEDAELLLKLSLPLVQFLKEKGSPYDAVVITKDLIRVTTDELGIPINTK